MESILTQRGVTLLAGAVATGVPLHVSKYRLGAAIGVPMNDGLITDVIDFIHEGESGVPGEGTIRINLVNRDTVRFELTLPPELELPLPGIGNVLLLTQDNEPFLFGSLRTHHPKLGNQVDNLGDVKAFVFNVKYSNLSSLVNVSFVETTHVNLPYLATQFDLPNPGGTPYDNYNTGEFSFWCRPFIAHRKLDANEWYGTPFNQNVKSLDFGILNGGVVGDNYPTLVEFYFGGYLNRRSDIRDGADTLTLLNYDLVCGDYVTTLDDEILDLGGYSQDPIPPAQPNNPPY